MVRLGASPDFSAGIGEYYSGRHLEQDIFGKMRRTREYTEAENELIREVNKVGKGRFIESEEMRDLIKEHYKDNPTAPMKEFASDVRLEIADQIGFGTNEEMESLRFYTAVDTAYDILSGVDAWVEVDLGNGKIAEVRLDATLNPDKNSKTAKSDIVIRKVPKSSHGDEAYFNNVERYGGQIATLLKKRMEAIAKGGNPKEVNKKGFIVV